MNDCSLGDIVARLGGQLRGDPALRIHRVATLAQAGEGDITFLANPKYRGQLAATQATAVVLHQDQADGCPVACIVTPEPYLYFARLSGLLNPPAPVKLGLGIGAVSESSVPASVAVGPNSVIGPEVMIGNDVVIGASCYIGAGAEIGDGTRLFPGVTIYSGCRIGKRCIVHAGVVIGADGFGFAREPDGTWLKIPQVGRVLIGDDVEVGANTTIDRGALGDTVIGNGVKLDNQIQVAHNVRIGDDTAIAGCVGIAGSAVIGRRCTIGGGAIILGHLELADEVHVSAGTLVGKNIAQAGTYTGSVPFMPHPEWLHNFSRIRHLDHLADKIRALENRIAELEQKS